MKYLLGFLALLVLVAAWRERRTVVVVDRQQYAPPPLVSHVVRTVAVEREEVTEAKPACHTIIGDTLKFTVLIVSDVVGIFVPVEEKRKEILRARMVEGW